MPDLTDAQLDEMTVSAVRNDRQLAILHDMLDYDVAALHAPAAYMEAREWMRAETVVGDLVAEVRRLRTAIAAGDEIHAPVPYADAALREAVAATGRSSSLALASTPVLPAEVCSHCRGPVDEAVAWPCATHRALHPEEADHAE